MNFGFFGSILSASFLLAYNVAITAMFAEPDYRYHYFIVPVEIILAGYGAIVLMRLVECRSRFASERLRTTRFCATGVRAALRFIVLPAQKGRVLTSIAKCNFSLRYRLMNSISSCRCGADGVRIGVYASPSSVLTWGVNVSILFRAMTRWCRSQIWHPRLLYFLTALTAASAFISWTAFMSAHVS